MKGKCTWRCKRWLSVIGRGWLRVWIVIFLLCVASLRIAAFIKLIKVGAACWQELLCSTVYPKLPSSFWSSITIAPYLHVTMITFLYTLKILKLISSNPCCWISIYFISILANCRWTIMSLNTIDYHLENLSLLIWRYFLCWRSLRSLV